MTDEGTIWQEIWRWLDEHNAELRIRPGPGIRTSETWAACVKVGGMEHQCLGQDPLHAAYGALSGARAYADSSAEAP